jgi:hypothetical protein
MNPIKRPAFYDSTTELTLHSPVTTEAKFVWCWRLEVNPRVSVDLTANIGRLTHDSAVRIIDWALPTMQPGVRHKALAKQMVMDVAASPSVTTKEAPPVSKPVYSGLETAEETEAITVTIRRSVVEFGKFVTVTKTKSAKVFDGSMAARPVAVVDYGVHHLHGHQAEAFFMEQVADPLNIRKHIEFLLSNMEHRVGTVTLTIDTDFLQKAL